MKQNILPANSVWLNGARMTASKDQIEAREESGDLAYRACRWRYTRLQSQPPFPHHGVDS